MVVNWTWSNAAIGGPIAGQRVSAYAEIGGLPNYWLSAIFALGQIGHGFDSVETNEN